MPKALDMQNNVLSISKYTGWGGKKAKIESNAGAW
jgi:hypothetical protein